MSAYLKMTGEDRFARSTDVYYPVHFADRRIFTRRPALTRKHFTEETRCLHIWAPIKRFCARRFDGVPPEGSFLAQLLEQHGIDASAAPVADQKDRSVVE